MVEREWATRLSESGEISAVAAIPSHDFGTDDTCNSIPGKCARQSCRMASRIWAGSVFLLRTPHPAHSSERSSHLAGSHACEHGLADCKPSGAAARSAGRLSVESRTSLSGVGDCHCGSVFRLQMVCGSKS